MSNSIATFAHDLRVLWTVFLANETLIEQLMEDDSEQSYTQLDVAYDIHLQAMDQLTDMLQRIGIDRTTAHTMILRPQYRQRMNNIITKGVKH